MSAPMSRFGPEPVPNCCRKLALAFRRPMESGGERRNISGRIERLVRRFIPSTAVLTRGWPARLLDAADFPSRLFHPEFRELPPNHLRVRVGTGNRVLFNQSQFQRLGAHECLDMFSRGWLKPDSSLIDIGCGCGRTAAPLRQAAGFFGTYLGIDVDEEMIAWCRTHLTDERFFFEHADTYNSVYNPAGSRDAYRLPVEDASQDLVISYSLFTHLLERDLLNYVSEASRALKPTGTMVMTVFCLDHPESAAGRLARFSFRHPVGEAMVEDAGLPEAAVAYPSRFLIESCLNSGFGAARVESTPGQSQLIATIEP